jgi:protocatechuate 3,4-dioxygenase beta subunit
MSDELNRGAPTPPPNQETELLIAWLLGDLSPEQAKRAEELWKDRPEQVEAWRSFLGITQQIGRKIRSQAEQVPVELPAVSHPRETVLSTHEEDDAEAVAPTAGRATLLRAWRVLRSQVPRRIIPVAILSPLAIICLFWLMRMPFFTGTASFYAVFSVLTPSVQVLDQGMWLPSGPIGVNAQMRLIGPTAATRLEWNNGRCQTIVSGPCRLLVTEPTLGIMHQEGEADYEIIAPDYPLRLWTASGIVEVSAAQLRLSGTSSILHYNLREGSIRFSTSGITLRAPAMGVWGAGNPDLVRHALEEPTDTNADADASSTPMFASAYAPTIPSPKQDTSESRPPQAQIGETPSHRLYGQVIRTDHSPVENARVTLQYYEYSTRYSVFRGDRITTTTGSDGRFHFRALLPAPSALLYVEHPELVLDRPYHFVKLDQENLQVLLFDTGSISGRVVSREKQPVGTITIEVLGVQGRYGWTAVTGLRGADAQRVTIHTEQDTFEVTGLAPGVYRLRATSSFGQIGESADIVLDLEEARSGVEISLVPGGMLVGRVISGESLAGIAGASVEVIALAQLRENEGHRDAQELARHESDAASAPAPRGQRRRGADANRKTTLVPCDERGDFVVMGLAPGDYRVRAFAESYRETRVSVPIKVGETREEILELYAEPGVLFGKVVDQDGRGIAGARVRGEHAPENMYDRVETTTNADGGYELTVSPGRWALRAQAPDDQASWARETVEMETPMRVERNFVLFPGVRVFGTITQGGEPLMLNRIEFAGVSSATRGGGRATTDANGYYETLLRQGQYAVVVAGQRRATLDLQGKAQVRRDIEIPDNVINGTVSDARTQTPLSKMWVLLEQLDGGGTTMAGRQPRIVITHRNGFFELRAVEPGTYRLRAAAEGYVETAGVQVDIPPGDGTVRTFALNLQAAEAILDVTITNAMTGKPLSGVLASRGISADTGEQIHVVGRPFLSDSSGAYVITNLLPGTYNFTFSRAMGHGSWFLPTTCPGVTVHSGTENRLAVAMEPGGSLRVHVRVEPEEPAGVVVPLPGTQVRLIAPPRALQLGLCLEAKTDLDGRVTFEPLPAGNYSVEITAPKLATVLRPATLTAAERTELDVLLQAPDAQ